jgi:hypothetical protein
MIHLNISAIICRAVLLSCVFSSNLQVSADTGLITRNHFPTITASGRQIESIFDGRVPNDYVRSMVLLRIDDRRRFALSDPSRRDINKMFRRQLVTEALPVQGCSTGGICAQPGTTSAPGQLCQDPSGCLVFTNNQANSDDFTQGTNENFECLQCCISWDSCTIGGDGGGPEPPIPPGPSPIIVDIEAEGFHLTDAPRGVLFDISGTGHPTQMGWTDGHFHNAFLALPGPDGLVHNGKELFGNFAPQPQSANPNGFIALAQYDKPENGGNGDGILDERDVIFSRLRLWIDENHDGISQPNELHRLSEFGVYSLSLKYVESRRTDEFGNQFRYKSQVNPGEQRDRRDQTASGEPGRWTFDVFFTLK